MSSIESAYEAPDNDWIPGADYAAEGRDRAQGHHYFPQANFRDLPLADETRRVFQDAKTGRLYAAGHRWDFDHAQYNRATKELFDRLLAENNLPPERGTPDQARTFLKSIEDSRDARIRNYNLRIRFREILYRVRMGRGNE